MTCQEQHRDQVLLYVAGVLDEEQQRALEEHLETSCPTCAAYLAEAEATLANLTLALPPAAPSDAARERLMARVQRERRDDQRAADAPPAPAPNAEPSTRDANRHANRGVLHRLVPLLASSGLAAAVTGAVMWVPLNNQHQRINDLEQRLTAAGETVTQQETSLEQMQSAIQGTARVFDSLYSSAAQFVSFTSRDESYTDTVARMLWDKDRNICHFFVRQLRPSDEGKTYHLWLMTEDEKVVRAGRFDPDADGGKHFQFELPEGVDSFTRAGISYAAAEEEDDADLRGALVLEGSLTDGRGQ